MGKHPGRIASGCDHLTRTLIAIEIERLIGLLDALDGDPDFEPDTDGEPWLCAWGLVGDPGDDRERDTADDEPEPEGYA